MEDAINYLVASNVPQLLATSEYGHEIGSQLVAETVVNSRFLESEPLTTDGTMYQCITGTQFMVIMNSLNQQDCIPVWGWDLIGVVMICFPILWYVSRDKIRRERTAKCFGMGDLCMTGCHLATIGWCAHAVSAGYVIEEFILLLGICCVITLNQVVSVFTMRGGSMTTTFAWFAMMLFVLPRFWGVAWQSGDSEPRDSDTGTAFLVLFGMIVGNIFVTMCPTGDRGYFPIKFKVSDKVYAVEDELSEEKRSSLGGRDSADDAVVRRDPQTYACVYQKLMFSFLGKDIALAKKGMYDEKDVPEPEQEDQIEAIADGIRKEWEIELQKPPDKIRLKSVLFRYCKSIWYATFWIKLIHDTANILPTFLLQRMITYLHLCQVVDNVYGPQCPEGEGYLLVVLFTLHGVFIALCQNQYFHRTTKNGLRLKAAAMVLIYEKSLRFDLIAGQDDPKSFSTGTILTLLSVDAQRFQEVMVYMHIAWSGPYQIVLALVYIYLILDYTVLVLLGIILLFIPMMGFFGKKIGKLTKLVMAEKDKRMKYTNELFGAARLLKMYAWEVPFVERISAVRIEEMRRLKISMVKRSQMRGFFMGSKTILGLACLAFYQIVYDDLDTSKAIATLSLCSMLQFPLMVITMVISSIVECMVAIKRIQKFLLGPEVPEATKNNGDLLKKGLSLEAKDVKLTWPNGEVLLEKVDFSSKAGKSLTLISGQVGTGKSGLLSAIIGELKPKEGEINISGTIAYAGQVPWIRHASVRENIIFDKKYDKDLYMSVVEAVRLLADLQAMPHNDETEIGEKGINLSGGQKARVALARALYAQADILIIDDALSAVDAHVMRALLQALTDPKLVKNTSVILATHQDAAIPYADQVISLGCDKNVQYVGDAEGYCKYMEVDMPSMNVDEPQSPTYVDSSESTKIENPETVTSQSSLRDIVDKKHKKHGELHTEEETGSGNQPWRLYLDYARRCGGIVFCCIMLLGVIFGQLVNVGADWWVAFWTDHMPGLTPIPDPIIEDGVGIGTYAGITAVTVAWQLLFAYVLYGAGARASVSYHNSALESMSKAPVVYFDTTPLGRVLNIFSKDIWVIDEQLIQSMNMYLITLLIVVFAMVVVAMGQPRFLIALPFLFVIYKMAEWYYVPFAIAIKRIEGVLRSPIFENFSETLHGLTSIRACNATSVFNKWAMERLHNDNRAFACLLVSQRWLQVRLLLLGAVIMLVVSALTVSYSDTSPGAVGIAIMYAFNVTNALNWMVRQAAENSSHMVSVERLERVIGEPQEAERRLPTDDELEKTSWPSEGKIDFVNVEMRYREKLPLVLRGFSATVESQWKVGVTGRTGAGKSSLLQTLLRMTEIEGGNIFIDGQNIKGVGLHTLRRAIAIIPQVLFTNYFQYFFHVGFTLSSSFTFWQ